MQAKIILITVFIFCLKNTTLAQTCTTLGQNPSTAFPVCGSTVFKQASVPICSSNSLFVPGCSNTGNANYANKNPFWYKFTCFASGSLGFLITPLNLNDDYDWQLYDITNHNPDDIFTDNSLIVTGNWAGTYGATGASASGVNYIQCGSLPSENKPSFAAMPNLILGHEYLLLISHFTDSQSGYSLSFNGGTASITDPKEPHLLGARAACDGTQATLTINKQMKCSSLATDGSEFFITPSAANVISATGIGCANGFNMDSLVLTLDKPLPPGNYSITIKTGSDGNTLLDYCDRQVPVAETIPMVVYPAFPTPMDSLQPIFCAPNELVIDFSKQLRYIRCNSIAPDGSDFVINGLSGAAPVTISSAAGICNSNGLTPLIKVKLSAPIQTKGIYQIMLKTGSDGNTIINECGKETLAGTSLSFTTADTVNANFTYQVNLGCKKDTIHYFHDGNNEVNFWKWNFENKQVSSLQNPTNIYSVFGQKTAQLTVTNGVCTATSPVVLILLDNYLKASFEATNLVCPGDLATFKDTSIGNIISWKWDFANGNTSILKTPPLQIYPYTNIVHDVFPMLMVTNNLGCIDTAYQKIKVIGNCYIAVPNAFTPNNDGLNDYLYPLNAYKAKDLIFKVFNRFGQLVFYTTDWTNKWDGSFKGQATDPATYVWILQYTNTDTGKRIEQKGSTVLIR